VEKCIVYNSDDGTILFSFTAHDGQFWDVRFSPNSKYILTGSQPPPSDRDCRLKIFDYEGKFVKDLKGHTEGVVCCIWSNCSKYVISSGYQTDVLIWDVDTGKIISQLSGHTLGIFALSLQCTSFIRIEWPVERLIWLAKMKNNPKDCKLSTVPVEIIKIILTYCGYPPFHHTLLPTSKPPTDQLFTSSADADF